MPNYVFELLSGEKLTKAEFSKYIEKKVAKTISQFKLIEKGDKVGVAVSGGKDSLVLLHLLAKQKNIELQAILIDEGIAGYRDKTIPKAQEICKKLNVPLKILSYEEEFGEPLDKIVKKGFYPCSVCGVFRRKLLNKAARELGCTKLATGHNLDDEAQAILMNQYKNNLALSARMGPISGKKDHEGFVRRIKPLYLITEKEVMTYAFLHQLTDNFTECKYVNESFRRDIQEQLNLLEEKHPGSKQGLVKSFLETLPLLHESHKGTIPIRNCEKCGEPASSKLCNACVMEERVHKKPKLSQLK